MTIQHTLKGKAKQRHVYIYIGRLFKIVEFNPRITLGDPVLMYSTVGTYTRRDIKMEAVGHTSREDEHTTAVV